MSEISTASSVEDKLHELGETIQREKVELSPEIRSLLETNLEKVQEKLRKREPITEEDMGFIARVREWVEMMINLERDYRATKAMYQHYELFIPGTEQIEASDGKKYPFPSWAHVRTRILAIPDFERKRKEMQEPRLNVSALIPIQAYAVAIDIHKIVGQWGRYFWGEIKDQDLRYNLASIDAENHGGITKQQLVPQQKGFIISVDEAALEIKPDPLIKKNSKGQELTNREKQQQYFEMYQRTGLKGLTYEQYLCLVMRALQEGEKMDENTTLTIFVNTIIDKNPAVPYGFWTESLVPLRRYSPESRSGGLRCRSSMWG